MASLQETSTPVAMGISILTVCGEGVGVKHTRMLPQDHGFNKTMVSTRPRTTKLERAQLAAHGPKVSTDVEQYSSRLRTAQTLCSSHVTILKANE